MTISHYPIFSSLLTIENHDYPEESTFPACFYHVLPRYAAVLTAKQERQAGVSSANIWYTSGNSWGPQMTTGVRNWLTCDQHIHCLWGPLDKSNNNGL